MMISESNSPECILLIDDDEATNFVHQMIIEKCGCSSHLQFAYNGKEALEYLTKKGKYENNVDPLPGIIFLDINMPLMNGWEFLEEYKTLPDEIKASVVIAMLTTSLNPDDAEKANSYSDIKGYLNKPLTKETFSMIIERYNTASQ